ncbi:hypothetical protein [Atlantibacter subterraneus]|nr:hypothetical protein [Atlantibacter subterranea]MDW2743246.1 hypothetical protein [Atlantibacter subterranea]
MRYAPAWRNAIVVLCRRKNCGAIMRKTTWILIAVAIVVWAASQAGWI